MKTSCIRSLRRVALALLLLLANRREVLDALAGPGLAVVG